MHTYNVVSAHTYYAWQMQHTFSCRHVIYAAYHWACLPYRIVIPIKCSITFPLISLSCSFDYSLSASSNPLLSFDKLQNMYCYIAAGLASCPPHHLFFTHMFSQKKILSFSINFFLFLFTCFPMSTFS